MRVANGRCRRLVEAQTPFKGSNLEAIKHIWYQQRRLKIKYVVYSYGWYPILACINGKWYENQDKYSVTTSKQTSQARPGVTVELVSGDRIRGLISGTCK